jgi:hypothetical protein
MKIQNKENNFDISTKGPFWRFDYNFDNLFNKTKKNELRLKNLSLMVNKEIYI